CTCDGTSRAPALSWGTPPKGTKTFAVVMHHITRENDTHVYMVVANIPTASREIKSGDATLGTWGQNTVNRKDAYAPPCSQGPGDKTYTITLYALSAEAVLPKGTPLTRDALLAAIKDTTLGTATLDVKYARVAK
ncbi:MAG: YbhB/YbcL family Raf kinase inhibitor-like protein, partial [Phycisphaerales bacterium]